MSSLSTDVGFPFTHSTHANRKIETNSQDLYAFHTESCAVRKLPIFISSSCDWYSYSPERKKNRHEKENIKL